MAFIITATRTKDENCVEACPIGCIHPAKDKAKSAEVPHLFINPDECTDGVGSTPLYASSL